ncbi:acyl-homoserine-lactone synthase [Aeromonas sp. HMWF014]|jgi:N-acyl-L-homoserine lactone synthetase|uniref:acyl-homoserine-lactone synthase n=1 Tax=Aeromonas sp. HMWF014 TaxID=2056850 RepID=UPI000D37F89E|nr:acyl-homoserine-lactone synthase [Aeromonas sp. HMWF014]PTT44488.1 acyl-homoserine-lactone synthase [Aeromonas sp. HMWF014]
MLVFTGKLRDHPRYELENELYRFRKRVFSDRLGWDVESHRGLERDGFDTPDTHWVLIEDDEGLCGCIRLLSCAQDYMLPSIFPTALAGEMAPRSNDVWELTRLAIDANRAPRMGNGVSELTCVLLREVYAFAQTNNIKEVIGVASMPAERIFRRLGLPMERLGHRQAVDLGAVRGVGIRFHLDERFARAVGQPMQGEYADARELVTE